MARARRRTHVKNYAVAAMLFMAISVSVWQVAERPAGVVAVTEWPEGVAAETGEFLPLTYSNVPVTGGHIVRLEVSRTALTVFGVEPADSLDGSRPDTILADVLVGEDGLARAVRFVRPETTVAQEEQRQ